MSEPVTFPAPEPNAALVVGPEDYLVLSYPAAINRQQFDELTASVYDRWPALDGRILFVVGAEQMAVVSPKPEVEA